MRIVELKLYKFHELSDKAKEVARQWWRDGSCFDIESSMITEDMNCFLTEEEDFETQSDGGVEWNLGYTQSDYVGLNGKFKKKKNTQDGYGTINKQRTQMV